MSIRWLLWGNADFSRGMGGVETHVRCLARELARLGVDVRISRDPGDLTGDWEVIHTHGSSVPAGGVARLIGEGGGLRVHTLHGTTLGRMAACREWAWPGGYLAAARELRAVRESDLVATVREDLWLLRAARASVLCHNGWDAGESDEPLSEPLAAALAAGPERWAFIGRGADKVKGTDRIARALRLMPDVRLVAAPGDGFDGLGEDQVLRTGELTAGQVRTLLAGSRGLILGSRYEGNPLVVLEALAAGIPVVTTPVGVARDFAVGVQGLYVAANADPRSLADSVRGAQALDASPEARAARAVANRLLLPSWADVARRVRDAVIGLVSGR